MQFETFDRDETTGLTDPAGPLVRVTHGGTLMFNRPAAVFLEEQHGGGAERPEVALLFAAESRTAGVRPLAGAEALTLPAGARWPVRPNRSLGWPYGVSAPEFVERYRIGDGEYPAALRRGPGPRMVAFAARLPAGQRQSPSRGTRGMTQIGAA